MIYLDNAAATPLDDAIFEAMTPFLRGDYGNPGTLYSLGRKARDAVETAREQVASFIGALPEQIIFTSGGAEANNLAVAGVIPHLKFFGKPEIVTTAIEHPTVRGAVIHAAGERCGFTHQFVFPDRYGEISCYDIEERINKSTGLVSVMFVNNETGTVNNVFDIGKACRENGVLFHTDCVQAAPEIRLDVKEIGCDMLSVSSHKIHGPKGAGALFVKNKDILAPLIYGSASQEYGLRGGTLNVPAVVGFGKACELMKNEDARYTRAEEIKLIFYKEFLKRLGEIGVGFRVNGKSPENGGRILNVCIPGFDAETLVITLDNLGVCVSAGAACNGAGQVPSRVLRAMGLSADEARSSVRISFSHTNTEQEAVEAAALFQKALVFLLETCA